MRALLFYIHMQYLRIMSILFIVYQGPGAQSQPSGNMASSPWLQPREGLLILRSTGLSGPDQAFDLLRLFRSLLR